MRLIHFLVLIILVLSNATAQTNKPGPPTSAKQKIEQAKTLLSEAKQALNDEGKYNCCTEEACDVCALAHQNCNCWKAVKSDKPVCPECFAGWQHGEGRVPSVDPAQVKLESHHHKH
jgi:hypothetical protein